MRIEKTEQGKTKNGLRYYLFPRTGFGEQIAAVLVQRGANHLFWKRWRENLLSAGNGAFYRA